MMLLDGPVVAEPLLERPNPGVVKWLNQQAAETCFLTALTFADLVRRIDRLPVYKRKSVHGLDFAVILIEMFKGRVLPFDVEAVSNYAHVMRMARRTGVRVSREQAQVAAMAFSRGMIVASRDHMVFLATGVTVINPWT